MDAYRIKSLRPRATRHQMATKVWALPGASIMLFC